MHTASLGVRDAALLLLLGCAVCVSRADAQDTLDGWWSGQLNRDGLGWDLALHVAAGDRGPTATIDVDALWLARQPLPSFQVEDHDVRFELPRSMGRFEGRLQANGLAGEVTLADGGTAPLALRRTSSREAPRAEEMSWRTDDVSIAATLTLPAGKGPFPAVVVLHGSGDSSRESPPYGFWADYLPRLGVACLIYDKRGVGQSTGDWRRVGFQERARDVAGGLAQLRDHPDVDRTRLGLLAVSQGSWVAGLVARLDPAVAFVVHVSGPAVPVAEADTYALLAGLRREAWPERDISEHLALWKLNVEVARDPTSEETWQRLQKAIDEVRDRSWFVRDPYEPARRSTWRTWYHQVLDHDPRPVLEVLDIPMLWMFGAMDSQSDPAQNVAVLEEFRRQGKDYTIALYPGAGHGLLVPVDSRGRDGKLLTATPGFFPDLARWLHEQIMVQR